MGVQGLLSVCLERQDECTEGKVDLVKIAKEKEGIEIIVNFDFFQHEIVYQFLTGLSKLRGNPYLKILGGEYGSVDRYVTKLIEDLKSFGIELVFFVEESKGGSTETFKGKFDIWKERHEEMMCKNNQILDVCRGRMDIQEYMRKNLRVLPVVLKDQLLSAIKRCDCELNQIPGGEADLSLTRALMERKKAYAILSNDSDFCIFPEGRFIPIQLFDIEHHLHLGQPAEVPQKPLKLMVKVITTEKVMSMLEVPEHSIYFHLLALLPELFTKFIHVFTDVFMTLIKKALENFVGNRENSGNQHF